MRKETFFDSKLRVDGIAQINLHPNIDVQASHIKEMVDHVLMLNNSKPALVLMTIGEFCTFSKEAREYSVDPRKEMGAIAIAYVIDILAHRLTVNFFIRINKPAKPIKMFTNEQKAVEWLLQYKP